MDGTEAALTNLLGDLVVVQDGTVIKLFRCKQNVKTIKGHLRQRKGPTKGQISTLISYRQERCTARRSAEWSWCPRQRARCPSCCIGCSGQPFPCSQNACKCLSLCCAEMVSLLRCTRWHSQGWTCACHRLLSLLTGQNKRCGQTTELHLRPLEPLNAIA